MQYRIMDFRNRPPLPAYDNLFKIKLNKVMNPVLRWIGVQEFRILTGCIRPFGNRGAKTVTPSMLMVGKPGALEQWWREIDAANIDAVVANGRFSSDRGNISAEKLIELQDQYPRRFYGLAPVDLEKAPEESAADCERAVTELGLRGVNIEPGIRKRGSGPTNVDHPDLYPIYETMSALDAPMMVYTSPFSAGGFTIIRHAKVMGDPAPYDRVLKKFPKLKIILGHGAYPCVKEILALARRQPNLHICPDIYAFWPGGLHYQRDIELLQDQLLYGSAFPFMSMEEPLEETLKFPVSKQAMGKYLWGNGARLLKI